MRLAPVLDLFARNDFKALQECFGFLSAMRFDDADHDVVAVVFPGARGFEHGVGLAHARSCSDEDSKLADAAFLASGRLQQGFRRRPLITVASLICHEESCVSTGRVRSKSGRHRTVQCHVQRQHVHTWLAEDPENAAFDVLVHKLAQAIFGHIAGLRNTRHLEQRGLRRDVGVEPAGRGRHQIGRDSRIRRSPSCAYRRRLSYAR